MVMRFPNAEVGAQFSLPAGQHKLTLQFGDAFGRSYGEDLAETISIVVEGEDGVLFDGDGKIHEVTAANGIAAWFKTRYNDLDAQVGETLLFRFSSEHDVNIVSKESFDRCLRGPSDVELAN